MNIWNFGGSKYLIHTNQCQIQNQNSKLDKYYEFRKNYTKFLNMQPIVTSNAYAI